MQKQSSEKTGWFAGNINIWPIIIALSVVAALCIYIIIVPDAPAAISNFRAEAVNVLSPLYLWLAFICVVFLLGLSLSKYGGIKLGTGEPQFSTFSWGVMLFCSGMGSSIIYWAVLEWMYYYSAPPQGAKPFSQAAAELSTTYPLLHWSFSVWAMYAVGAIALAYRYYNLKKPGLSLTASCERTIGEKAANGPLGKIIELIFVFGILGGLSCTLAFGVPMICNNIAELFGIANSFGLKVGMMLFIAIVFLISSYIGLDKGLKNLADWNAYIAVGFAIFVLIAGPTMFEIKCFTNSFGVLVQDFIHMSLWTDPIANSGFPEAWTSFYWAWVIALAPWMWIFAAKVSKGRTIRQMIIGMIAFGSIGGFLFFGTISPTALHIQLHGVADLITVMQTQGHDAAINAFLLCLPFKTLVFLVWITISIMFLATTLDSASWTLAASVTKNLGTDEDPSKRLRLFWSLTLTAVPLAFIFTNADLSALQSMAILTAVPLALLTILTIVSAVQYLRDDYSMMSAAEIIADNRKRDRDAQNATEAVGNISDTNIA